jgi:hypothetical protein
MKIKLVRILSVILVCSMFLFAAVGCGSSDKTDKKDRHDTTEEEDKDTDETSGDETEAEDTEADETSSDVLSIDEGVLLDQDGIVITSKGLVEDDIWGVGISLQIENNSTADIGVMCNAVIVNGFMISDLFSSEITASNKANETLYLNSYELSEIGIDTIGQIELYFNVYDAVSYDTILDSEVITIQTSQFADMDTTSMDGGYILVDQDGVKVIGKYVDENSFWGKSVLLYIENNSGQDIDLGCDAMSINGFMVDPYFSSVVYDGKKAMTAMYIYDTDLEANGITSIDEIEVSFQVYDDATFSTLFETEPLFFAAS